MTSAPGAAVGRARGTTGVSATARLTARADGRGGTALPVLESDGPLALRRTRGSGDEARVMLVGAMSGPLGGDRFAVEAEVGAGARLHVGSAAATIALPGQAKGEAHYGVRIEVAAGGELRWLPEQLISAKGSDLYVSTRVELSEGARLVFREEQVLGRSGEEPGRLTSRLGVWSGGRPLLDQQVSCGPGAPGGWDGPAVLGGHRALGQLLVVRPEFAERAPGPRVLGETAALTPLAGPAVLVSALASDALRLRRVLDDALAELDG
ncbi:urease accessory protein UreD [Streptomyces scabiei]|uniref:urease accessory protein UreD n=5 Tax=Streptomyces scabiei TaxID=1930 RepID=UPI000AD64EF6|nr:urease accessory protein UreD [Streptomyces scabiei]MDX2533560.1 urease accessory protein UreD [Streptomyces scabiei]MDX2795883.1 urease accessory protein UreD [Streptomyces scabiei]MDX2829402.1 urease accessory protein UreD [Streptomyces scabiei]MDX2860492.1 urease accessory protein UreD [Streptomyces scabiei]MDX3675042.1 urease accessory protein UreD [Streptomyces scabiei]